MGYDIEFVQITVGSEVSFPIPAGAAKILIAKALPFEDPGAVRQTLLGLDGAKPGEGEAVDYLGRGLNYARFTVHKKAIHVDNNLNAAGLIKIYNALLEIYPALLILDLQNGQLHTAGSFADWWSRPL